MRTRRRITLLLLLTRSIMENLSAAISFLSPLEKCSPPRDLLWPRPAPPKRNLGNISNRVLEVEIGGG